MKGIIRGTVTVVPHDNRWAKDAMHCISLLNRILKHDAIDVQHVGSTAILGIYAKPIIDIVVGVNNFQDILKHNDELSKQGIYYRKKEHGEQLLYVCGDMVNEIRTHHIHVVIMNSEAWYNYLNFRDYMNSHEEDAKAYSELKKELSKQYSNDRTAYTAEKQMFIDCILQKAAAWRAKEEKTQSLL